MKTFLTDYFIKEEIELIEKSQKARIDTQYYSDRNISEELYNKIRKNTPLFMVKCKKVLNEITESEIKKIRTDLKNEK